MGAYLLTIASYDGVYQDRYAFHALEWTSSWKCSFCGFLAMLSSELSVLVLTLITIERYRCICCDSYFSRVSMVTLSSARVNLIIIWSAAVIIASLPLLIWGPLVSTPSSLSSLVSGLFSTSITSGSGSSMNQKLVSPAASTFTSQSYYGSSGLCFPLHIDEPYATGKEIWSRRESCFGTHQKGHLASA